MSDWPVGISTGCFYKQSFFETIESIRAAGFAKIEVCSAPAHLDYHDTQAIRSASSLMERLGLETYSFHAPFRKDIDITSPQDSQREHSLREMILAAEAAALLKAGYYVAHPGPETDLDPSPGEKMERMKRAAGAFSRVAERCQELGIGLLLENMLPHLMFGHTSDLLWITGAVKHVNLAACLDTGHAFLNDDLHRVMYKLSGNLRLIHANDNRGSEDEHLPPGRGSIDWSKLLFELNETGFRGAFILELSGETNRSNQEVLNEAGQARLYLNRLSKQLRLAGPPAVEVAGIPPRP
jgi:sugar phosphate isomerase/epimerase